MEVKLINDAEVINLFYNWGEFACKCYNTPITYAKSVGKSCMKSGHFSGSRCEYFKFEISGISRACSLQLNRHNIGVVLNQQSQRYVDMTNVEFVMPPSIEKNEQAKELYLNLVENSKNTYKEIKEILTLANRSREQANEDARFALLESCETCGTWGFTLEALIHFMNLRLCKRSQWEIRLLAKMMREEVLNILPELEEHLVPQCDTLLYCPEGERCCGRKPTKEMMKLFLQTSKIQGGTLNETTQTT